MIVEYAQLLSTAHRVLDGVLTNSVKNNRKSKSFYLHDEREHYLYKATHINHPSAIWARQSASNYLWLFELYCELLDEYTHRYGKHHKCEGMIGWLAILPKNISTIKFTEPTPAMPDQYKVPGDSIQSYINYYNGDKQRMFKWKNREVPYFITGGV